MIPALLPEQLLREALACGGWGLWLGTLRAALPGRGRAGSWADFFLTGGLLLGTQSYAAALSQAGTLRWYMLAAAFGAAAAAERILAPPLRAAGRAGIRPLRWLSRRAAKGRAAQKNKRMARKRYAKERRNEKRLAKKAKKNLPSKQRMLYNSNVSK